MQLGQQAWLTKFSDQCNKDMERRTRQAQGQTKIMTILLFVIKERGFTHWGPLEKYFLQLKPDDFCQSKDDFKQKLGCSPQAAFMPPPCSSACAKHDEPSKGYELEHLDELGHALVKHGVPELYEHLLHVGAVSVQLLMLMAATKPKLKSLAHKADPDMADYIIDRIMDFARTLKRENERKAAENLQRLAVEQHKDLKRRRDPDATESEDEDDDEDDSTSDKSPRKRQAVDKACS